MEALMIEHQSVNRQIRPYSSSLKIMNYILCVLNCKLAHLRHYVLVHPRNKRNDSDGKLHTAQKNTMWNDEHYMH